MNVNILLRIPIFLPAAARGGHRIIEWDYNVFNIYGSLKNVNSTKKIKLPKSLGQWYIYTNGHNYSTVDPVQLSQKFYSGRMATFVPAEMLRWPYRATILRI